MEKARGEPSAPFISGAAWNLPSPHVPTSWQRCWLTPLSAGRGGESFLPHQSWPYKAQHSLQALAAPLHTFLLSCFRVWAQVSIQASPQHRAGVKEVWWDGPPASPDRRISWAGCASKTLSLIHPLWSSQKTLPEDLTFPCLP